MFGWFGKQPQSRVPTSLEKLQGEWKVIRIGKNGNRAPRLLMWIVRIRFRIDNDRYITSARGETIEEGRLTLQPHEEFAYLDQHVETGDDAGKTHLGIIRFVNGKLEHLQADVGDERPSGFPYSTATKAHMALTRRV